MKTLKLFLVTVLFSQICFSQINFENQFAQHNSGYTSVQMSFANLSSDGLKYRILSDSTNQLILYNSDYTLYKTINLVSPSAPYTVLYVTDGLFDTDNTNIEYLTWEFDISRVRIFREDGTMLFSKDSASVLGSGWVITDDSQYSTVTKIGNSYKLILKNPYTQEINIYSLPGSIPCLENCGTITGYKDNSNYSAQK